MADKLKLYGFNNLTKTLSFNIYDFCYAKTEKEQSEYVDYIDEMYNSERLTKILCDVTDMIGANVLNISKQDYDPQGASVTILIAEDSRMLRDLLLGTLHSAGYNTIDNENGQEAWDKLESFANGDVPVSDIIQLIITDIEMPRMDGHHLTKRIKSHPRLKELPVVIFSSLINEEMRLKGEALGAFAQITKPEIEQLIGIVDQKIAI